DEKAVTASAATMTNKDTFGTALGNSNFGGQAVGAIEHLDSDILGHRLRTRVIDVRLPVLGELWAFIGKPRRAATVERHHIVLTSLNVPERDHLNELVPMCFGEIVGLCGILHHVVEFPSPSVELPQLVFA